MYQTNVMTIDRTIIIKTEIATFSSSSGDKYENMITPAESRIIKIPVGRKNQLFFFRFSFFGISSPVLFSNE